MRWQKLGAAFLFSFAVQAGTLHLRTGEVRTTADVAELRMDGSRHFRSGRSHFLLQFHRQIEQDQLDLLAAKGAVVTASVPDFGLVVSAGDDFTADGLDLEFAGRLRGNFKRSAAVGDLNVVEFHADVDPADARALLAAQGLIVVEHPNLLKNHVMVSGSLEGLEEWDEVAYVFPASSDLSSGEAVYACGALSTTEGSTPMYATTGHGWPANGLNGATVQYVFGALSAKLAPSVTLQEVTRALMQWPKFANVHFVAGTDPTAAQTVAIHFASGDHGDGYPFDGAGGILAHTFYPTPTNPEPVAGDMHFDAAENWHSGTDVDLYSVALHEAGHALGLGHSDQPGSVMYPYYRMGVQISSYDIGAIQSLYGPPNGSAPVSPAPTAPAAPQAPALSLTIDNPSATLQTTAATEALTGRVANASGNASVSWQSDRGASGTGTGSSAWSILSVPLLVGSNTITVTAIDAQHRTDSKSVVVVRNSVTPSAPAPTPTSPTPTSPTPPGSDKAPPSLSLSSPSGTIVQTSQATITVSGSASSGAGLAKITWKNVLSGSGDAIGAASWTAPAIPLFPGTNTLVFTAVDKAGNTAWRSLTVVRR